MVVNKRLRLCRALTDLKSYVLHGLSSSARTDGLVLMRFVTNSHRYHSRLFKNFSRKVLLNTINGVLVVLIVVAVAMYYVFGMRKTARWKLRSRAAKASKLAYRSRCR